MDSKRDFLTKEFVIEHQNRAIEELEQAYEKGETNYLFVIKTDPLLDDLRGQPRFDALVQKIVGEKK